MRTGTPKERIDGLAKGAGHGIGSAGPWAITLLNSMASGLKMSAIEESFQVGSSSDR